MSDANLPRHFKFQDNFLGDVAFVQEGDWTGWLFKKHPDGQWVSMRLANADDLEKVQRVIAAGN